MFVAILGVIGGLILIFIAGPAFQDDMILISLGCRIAGAIVLISSIVAFFKSLALILKNGRGGKSHSSSSGTRGRPPRSTSYDYDDDDVPASTRTSYASREDVNSACLLSMSSSSRSGVSAFRDYYVWDEGNGSYVIDVNITCEIYPNGRQAWEIESGCRDCCEELLDSMKRKLDRLNCNWKINPKVDYRER